MADLPRNVSASDARSYVSRLAWALGGLVEVVLSAFALPLIILLVGLPVVLLIRVIIEIAHML
jgi:hypothetical protein